MAEQPSRDHWSFTEMGGLATWRRLAWIGTLIAFELLIISLIYKDNFDFTCRDSVPAAVCELYSRSVERAIAVLGVLLIFVLSQPRILRLLSDARPTAQPDMLWPMLQLGGFVLIILPGLFKLLFQFDISPFYLFVLWTSGAILAAGGSLLTAVSAQRWKLIAAELGSLRLGIIAIAALAPELTDGLHGVWYFDPLTKLTFQAVAGVLHLLDMPVISRPDLYEIETENFAIAIGWQCSGIEGFALTVLFVGCYFIAFARSLRFPQAWLLLPFALVLSWLLNIVRIAGLFYIGDRISPDLAVNGFHSHAGWLMFSVLAFSVIGMSRSIPFFVRDAGSRSANVPITQDSSAALIVPFAAFMGATLLLQTFSLTPDLWYGLKAVAMAAALSVYLPQYRKMDWRPGWFAVAAGVATGAAWIAANWHFGLTGGDATVLAEEMPNWMLSLWIALRFSGTILFVPIVEELFFRGYILRRIDRGGMAWRLAALLLSSLLFGAFHSRLVLGGLAGLVFGLLYLRRGRVSDAIYGHAACNAVIALSALISEDWGLI